MLRVFGDESHDATSERVFALAALFGSDAQWNALEIKWKARLGSRIFHGADCETDKGEFAGSEHADNQRLYADLTNILAESHILGFGSAMDLAGHWEFFPDSPKDVPYYRCFRDVVFQCAKWARMAIPPDIAEFYFDRRAESDFNASLVYEYMLSQSEWGCSAYLAPNLHSASRQEVGIQAADLYAREVMKHFDNMTGPKRRPMRRSFEALRKTNRFGCDLHTRSFFEDFKRQFEEVASKAGMSREGYRDWLRANQQADTISSRSRYLIAFDAAEREMKKPD